MSAGPGWTTDNFEAGDAEEELFSQLAKLYCFQETPGQAGTWDERGLGKAYLLKSKQTGKVRFALWNQKSGDELVCNHYVIGVGPYCDLRPNAGSEKCWVWVTQDCAREGTPVHAQFALKFGNTELAQSFKEHFDKAKQMNAEVADFADIFKSFENEDTSPNAEAAQEEGQKEEGKKTEELDADALKNQIMAEEKAKIAEEEAKAAKESEEKNEAAPAPQVNPFGNGLSGIKDVAGAGSVPNPFAAASSASLFAPTSAPQAQSGGAGEEEEDQYVAEEEITSIPGWTPSVTLDLKDNVATGEENEEELYTQLSKLYRYKDGDWKERGKGDAKLLKHKETGKVRFMLRQEKTGKIVGNHYVVAFESLCQLKPNAGSDKCFVWMAQDFSDGEMELEQLALKFGSPEKAEAFQQAFDNAKEMNKGLFDLTSSAGDAPSTAATPAAKEDGGAVQAQPAKTEEAAPSPAEAAPEAAPAPVNPFAGLSLSSSTETTGGGLFSGLFGASSGGAFGGGAFGGSVSSSTSAFAAPAAAPAASAAPAEGDDDEYVAEEEVTTVPGWVPSVTLEVQETVETGEENEEELFSQRSKLYRYRDGEWKERGLGEAKLLKDKASGKVRFMLRQEKTMKIVGNHYVVGVHPYCNLVPNCDSDKFWVWTAIECSDGEPEVTQLALKFGSPELASKFKEAFDEAKEINSHIPDFANFGEAQGKDGDEPKAAVPSNAKPSTERKAEASPDTSASVAAASKEKESAPTNGNAPSSGSSLFSNSTGSSLFSGSSSSLFSSSGSSGGLFSNVATGGLFSSPATGGLFSTPASGAATGGLFGNPASGGGLFSSPSSGGLFSSPASTSASSGGLFSTLGAGTGGGGLFDAPTSGAATDAKAPEQQQGDDDEYVAEEEVTVVPGWTASVTLEVQDKINTGEEDEAELYSQRSKLLRYRDGEWKERGLGNAKLLKHKETGKVRFMLRQEKTEKIVANHYVIHHETYCDLRPNAGSEKIWVWTVPDCADEEEGTVIEQFALKFGSPELAQEFKVQFDAAKDMNRETGAFAEVEGGDPSGSAEKPPASNQTSGATAKAQSSPERAGGREESAQSSSSLFAPSASSGTSLFGGSGLFSSGSSLFGSTGSSIFSSPASSSASSGSGLFSSILGSSSGSSSGSTAASTGSGGLWGSPSSGSLFTGTSSSSLFASTGASSSSLFSSTAASTGGLFSSMSSSSGGFLGAPAAASSGSTSGAGMGSEQKDQGNSATQEDEEYVVEEEVTTVPGWTPSVTLEVKDHIDMGEDDEQDIYSQRSKLLRWRDGEWKERGLGEAKLLKHKETGKIRFMLRQEKTLKIVANHYVVDHPPYCELRPNAGSDKIWVWTAPDYAEDEVVTEQFALKFGSPELANAFKEAFEQAKEANRSVIDVSGAGAAGQAPGAKDTSKEAEEAGKKFLEENKKKDGVTTLASGLQYKVLKKGDGRFHPEVSSPCACHYNGTFIDGTKFDSSPPGAPTTFAPNKVIKGWTEAMQLMVEGDKWELYIPFNLAYGSAGQPPKIPPKSTLIFQMELVKINGGKVEKKGVAPAEGASDNAASNPFAGLSISSAAAASGSSLFSAPSSGGGLFSQSSGSSLFSSASSSGSGGGLFGGMATGGLFSQPSSVGAATGGLFGSPPGQPSSGGLFSSPSSSSSSSSSGGLFSGGATSGGGLFSGAATGGLFSAPATGGLFSTASTGGLFSSPSSGGLFSTAANASTGGGLFSAPAAAEPESGATGGGAAAETADDERFVAEEEVTVVPGWAPSVTLEVRNDIGTGEESEQQLYCQRSKLLRFKDGDWKERGLGEAKLLKNPSTGQTRFLMRQEKTMKIVANHFVIDQEPYCSLKPNQGNEKIWVWTVPDCAEEGDPVIEQFALKFGTPELATAFKEAFDKVKTKPGAEPKNGAAASGSTSSAAAAGATSKAAPAPSKKPEAEEEDEDEEDDGEDGDYGDDDDYDETWDAGGEDISGSGCLASLAAAQATGWKCPSCMLRWPEEAVECSVCEIPRPGMEEAAAKNEEEKKKQMQATAALFTGSSSAPKSSGFSVSPPASGAAAPVFGFGAGPTPVVVPPPAKASGGGLFAPSTSGGMFGAPASSSGASTGAGLFGAPAVGASTGGMFGAPAAGGGLFASASSGSTAFGAPASASSGSTLFGSPASSSSFGAPASASSGSTLFGAPSTSASSGTGLFGGGLFGSSAASGGGGALFGGSASSGSSAAPPPPPPAPVESGGGLFAKSSSPLFAATPGPPPATTPAASSGSGLLFGVSAAEAFGQTASAEAPPPPPPPAATAPRIVPPLVATAAMSAATEADVLRVDEAARKEIRRLETQVREISEACERAEARARKAEERAKAVGDRGDSNEEALRSSLEQVRRELRSGLGDVRKQQLEDTTTIQSLQADQNKTSLITSRLQEDLRKESTARSALEVEYRSSADTAKHALSVAEDARQKAHDLEDSIKVRLETLEAQASKSDIKSLKKLSVPERIMYFQNQHRRSAVATIADKVAELQDCKPQLRPTSGTNVF